VIERHHPLHAETVAHHAEAAAAMTYRVLDTARWARGDAYEFFRRFDKPFFNVCVRLDVAPLKAALAASRSPGGVTLACYFVALKLANAHQPFRLRLAGDAVHVHDAVDGSTTVLREDGDSFGFADLEHGDDASAFMRRARVAIEAARNAVAPFEPKPGDVARIYFTALPWLHFTSFSHARRWAADGQRDDSIPRFAFGRIEADGARQWMPMSVEVHHALMDGVHLGRYVQDFEAALADPLAWLTPPPAAGGSGTPTTA
jgi:chloramphenicol O-acetyltransferase type A